MSASNFFCCEIQQKVSVEIKYKIIQVADKG